MANPENQLATNAPSFYDSFASRKRNRLGLFLVARLSEKLAKIAAKHSPVKILEIGIGRGVIYEKLKQEIPQMEYTGIEASETLCKQAKEKGINAIKCFIPPFPQELEKGSFDMIIMSHVLEHFASYKEILDVLGGMSNLLNPGGKILFFYPSASDWGNDFYECDYSHSYYTTQSRVDNMLHDSGFRVIMRDSYRACFNNFCWFFCIISRLLRLCAFLRINMRTTFNKNLLVVAEKL